MDKTRVILRELMSKTGDKPYDIQKKTGIQPSSIYRFLDGTYDELKTDTIQKLARLYNVTEGQLRGEIPIDGIVVPAEQKDLKDLLPLDQYRHIDNIKKLSDEERGILYKLSAILAHGAATVSESLVVNRRTSVKTPNNQLRAGEAHYNSPPRKSRIKEKTNATKQTGTA